MDTSPRNAVTDPDSGARFYEWEGRLYPSVTTLRRVAGIPFRLANWQVGQVIEAAMANTETLGMMAAAEGEDVARKWLRKEAMAKRDTAANLGTAVHVAAAAGIPVSKADPEVAPFLAQHYDFLAATGAEVVLSERQVWNLKLGYAGSLDALLRIDKRLVVTDYKTGKGIYSDHALQLMGYALGDFIGEDDVIDAEATTMLHKASALAILHLRPEGWELVEIGATPELFEVFKSMVKLARWLLDHDDISPLVVDRRTR